MRLDNFLSVFAFGQGQSFIKKKDVTKVSITVIPEPGTASLLALGLVALGQRAQRRRREGGVPTRE